MRRGIFVTGFGPFGSIEDNPSARLAQHSGRPHAVLTVAYAEVEAFLARPDLDEYGALLMLGVAAKRTKMCLELVARNVAGPTADMGGRILEPGPLEPEAGPTRRGTLWPSLGMHAAELAEEGPLALSEDAGDYLCNWSYYQGLRRFPEKLVGFLHVPPFEAIAFEEQLSVLRGILEQIEAHLLAPTTAG